MSRVAPIVIIISLLAGVGCNQKAREKLAGAISSSSDEKSVAAKSGKEEFLQIDEETTKEQIALMEAGKDFYKAIAAHQYDKAYDMLSPFAISNVSPDQFVDSDPTGEGKAPKSARIEKLTKEEFLAKMKDVEKRYGEPKRVGSLWVSEDDPAVLSGKDRVLAVFSIGAIPDSTPDDIRKAALRGQLIYKPGPEVTKQVVEQQGETVEEIEKDDPDAFYFSLKTVLVDDAGKLKIGYFEFVPPSIGD